MNYTITEDEYNAIDTARSQLNLVAGLLTSTDADKNLFNGSDLYYFLAAQIDALKGVISSVDDRYKAERLRRETIRWLIVLTLNEVRPVGASEHMVLTMVQSAYPDATPLELRRELDYLHGRGLVELDKQPNGKWFYALTRHGVDLAEYTVDCEPGVARPAKNIATLTRSSVNLKQFQSKVEADTRAQVLAEQRAKLDAMGNKGGVTEDTKRAIREALGIAATVTAKRPVARKRR